MEDLMQPEDPKRKPEEASKPAETSESGMPGLQEDVSEASSSETPPPSPYASENPQAPAPQDAQPYDPPQGQPVAPAMPPAASAQTSYDAPSQQPYAGQQPKAFPYQQPPYGQPPYGQQQPPVSPYQQHPIPPAQPPYGQQPPYSQHPYGQPPYGQPPYPCAPQPPRKKKVWPWVLGACLLVILLGMGGCVGCMACSILTSDYTGTTSRYPNGNAPYGYDDGYRHGYGYDDSTDSDSSDLNSPTFSKSEIEKIAKEHYGVEGGAAEGNKCTPGVYEVGVDKDIEPGLYYLEGSQTEEGSYLTFDRVDNSNVYTLDDSVVYFGNYFAEFEEGDLVVFAAPKDASMYPAPGKALNVSAPYRSGVYRVGIDIPAGTYKVVAQSDAPATKSQEAAAYVMKDLDFDDDSILETKYVIAGGSQTITVSQGQYVELYAATMAPVDQ